MEALSHIYVTASDGDEAWRLFREFRPDVLVIDHEMPGLNGIQLCEAAQYFALSTESPGWSS